VFREDAGIKLDVAPAIENRQSDMVGGSNSVVESQPSKLLVAGSIPVSRSRKLSAVSGRLERLIA
jgi:hypothetical protein